MRPSAFTLAVILVVAALLRFAALGSGIPFNIGVDEPEIMSRVVQMMRTGDFNPHFFDYPGLYFYVQLGVAVLRFLAGATLGEWSSLDQVQTADFYLWGRAVTATFGTLTVLLVYRIAMRWGARHAALAAGLMAVMPLHVRESHYVLTDVPVTFFVTLTLLLTLNAHERERAASFAWAGAAAGLAAATKYPGGLVDRRAAHRRLDDARDQALPARRLARRPRRRRHRLPGRGPVHHPGPARLPQRLRAPRRLLRAEAPGGTRLAHLLQAPVAQHGLAGVPPAPRRSRPRRRARRPRSRTRALDGHHRLPAALLLFPLRPDARLRTLPFAAPPLRLRAGRRRHRIRGQPAAPLRHPARAAHGRHRRAHRRRTPATGVAVARLHPHHRAHEHHRTGP